MPFRWPWIRRTPTPSPDVQKAVRDAQAACAAAALRRLTTDPLARAMERHAKENHFAQTFALALQLPTKDT